MRTLLVLLSLVAVVACGTPGAPQPPSLNIPKEVNDLKAVRKGDSVTLSWNAPEKTTDGALFRRTGKMIVHRATTDGQGSAQMGELPLEPALKTKKPQRPRAETWKDSISDLLRSSAGDFAIYTVEAENNAGKSSGVSNEVAVPLVLAPEAHKEVRAEVVPQGVSISWNQTWPPEGHTNLNVQYVYRVMRRLVGANQEPVMVKQLTAGNGAASVIDNTIEWERQYQYWVTPVTIWQKDDRQKGEFESDDSNVVEVTTRDVFPPAVPNGLQAVFSQVGAKSFIDLTWNPNTDADLAGYNVYRWTEGASPAKINRDLVKTPAFRDDAIQPGITYFYSISAVDVRNNESAHSQEASETVPK